MECFNVAPWYPALARTIDFERQLGNDEFVGTAERVPAGSPRNWTP